jgi:hypothetical protein
MLISDLLYRPDALQGCVNRPNRLDSYTPAGLSCRRRITRIADAGTASISEQSFESTVVRTTMGGGISIRRPKRLNRPVGIHVEGAERSSAEEVQGGVQPQEEVLFQLSMKEDVKFLKKQDRGMACASLASSTCPSESNRSIPQYGRPPPSSTSHPTFENGLRAGRRTSAISRTMFAAFSRTSV